CCTVMMDFSRPPNNGELPTMSSETLSLGTVGCWTPHCLCALCTNEVAFLLYENSSSPSSNS
ncbi:hypothetical protein NDU88_000081, partial [Pleurodeles waltl]